MSKSLVKAVLFLLLLLIASPCLAAESVGSMVEWGPGQVVLWLVVELHFLAIMVLTGAALLAVAMDSCGFLLGKSLAVGDGLWRNLYSRLSVMFSFLGLAGLAVAGLFPREAQTWLGIFAPTFGTHVFFGVLGLAGGYGVLCCRTETEHNRGTSVANTAFILVELLLIIGFVSYLFGMQDYNAEALLKAGTCFALPAVLLAWFRNHNNMQALRLTFESTSAFAFLVLLNIASAWRNADLDPDLLVDVFHSLALRETIFHAIAAMGLVSMLELAGDLGSSQAGVLGQELQRVGGDSRWFLVAAVVSLTMLPFMGFLASQKAAPGSWLLVFQGGLVLTVLLTLNYELWARLELTKAKSNSRGWLWAAVFILGSIVLVTPAATPMSDAERILMAGFDNSVGFAIWGTAPLKNVAFTLMSLVSFDAVLCMVDAEIHHESMSIQSKPRFQAVAWLTGILALVFCLGGFSSVRGIASPGSVWDLTRLTLLDTDTAKYQERVNQSRGACLQGLGLKAVPRYRASPAELAKSRLEQIPAVRQAWLLRDLRGQTSHDAEARKKIRQLATRLTDCPLTETEIEALGLERLIHSGSADVAKKHFGNLTVLLRAVDDQRLLADNYRLSETDRQSLLIPLLLILIHGIGLLIACDRMSRSGWHAGYRLFLSLAGIELVGLFCWAHAMNLDSAALVQRLYGLDQVIVLSTCMFLGVSRLALMALSENVQVYRDVCSLGLNPQKSALHKFEIVAAVAYVFTLILGGWAQSGSVLSDIRRASWGDRGSWILNFVTSANNSALGSAIKSTVVVGMTLAVILAATRFFLWATQSNESSTEEEWGLHRSELTVIGSILALFMAYLALEWTVIGLALVCIAVSLFVSSPRWRIVPWLACLFVLVFLFVGLECSKLEIVKQHTLLNIKASVTPQVSKKQ